MNHLLFIFGSIVSLAVSFCAVIPSIDPVSYLSRYGYIKGIESRFDPRNIIATTELTKAIAKYQNYFNLEVTGEMNSDTENLMSQPRCGVPDNLYELNSRLKRFVLLESKWMKRNLTYKINKYPKRLSVESVESDIQRAFNVWTNHVDIKIRSKKLGKVDINLSFEFGDHGCIWGFDGAGGTLAHAYSPGHPDYTGDAHFDAAENWSVNSTEGVNLFQVSVHEFGHSLGLDHSNDRNAIMYPIYRKLDSNLKLHQDDILGIQELYGKKNKTTRRRSKVPPKVCNIGSIFNVNDKVIMFKDNHYYQMNESGVVENSSMAISSKWPKLPEGIDAAFNYLNNKTFFFKGSKYWRYSNGSMDEDYPKEIEIGFPGVPDNIEAVTRLPNGEEIYFFKGDLFWTFDTSNMLQGKQCFSTGISLKFKGLPNNIDGAFKHSDGHVYFVKSSKLYRFNEVLQKVDQVLEHKWRC